MIFSEIYLAMAIAGTSSPKNIVNVKEGDVLIYNLELERRKQARSLLLKNNALLEAGKMLRKHILESGISNFQVNWIGHKCLSGIESVAKDLEISPLNWRVSVKENADVFINSSAITAFIDLPQGRFGQKVQGKDWFIETALNELQNYYVSCDGHNFTGFATVQEYYNQVEAVPKKAGQPGVILNFSFKDKQSNKIFIIPLKIEIRRSHGKFCGNPEAKVYKQWSYTSLPWVKIIDSCDFSDNTKLNRNVFSSCFSE